MKDKNTKKSNNEPDMIYAKTLHTGCPEDSFSTLEGPGPTIEDYKKVGWIVEKEMDGYIYLKRPSV